MNALPKEFSFAGFDWPRYVANMAQGEKALRAKWAKPRVTGGYYHAPNPYRKDRGVGFYLGRKGKQGEGQPAPRWQWCDEAWQVRPDGLWSGDMVRIHHNGWYCDEFQDQTIRGIVFYLPHGRYLAGWAMGDGMCGSVPATLYDDLNDAIRAADSMAERAAEDEREYQEQHREEDDVPD